MNLQKVMTNVVDQLQNRVTGYAVTVFQGKDLKYSTSAGHSDIGHSVKMTSRTRMGVMSMSKTVTASAVVSLLPWKGLTVDSAIAPFLPSSWVKGANVDKLTFRMLLTHGSGFVPVSAGPDTNSMAFANLQKMIAAGSPGGVPAVGQYRNENYALLRVLLPYFWHGPQTMESRAASAPKSFPKFVGDEYVKICKSIPLANPALHDVSVVPTGTTPFTRIYNFQNIAQSAPSGQSTDGLYAGADHWFMSAREYGSFITDLRAGTYVLSTNFWDTMTQTRATNAGDLPAYPGGDARLGTWRFAGKNGEYFGHNGGYVFGSSEQNVVGSFAGWMAFPGGVTAVMLANSNLWFGNEQEKILMDAYDAA